MMTLKDWIKACEGYSEFPYRDTVGKLTIGYGRNLDDVGISREEAEILLDNEIAENIKELSEFSWYRDQPLSVQEALVNMCFNMGLPHLLTFDKMIAALNAKNYTLAAIETLNSEWAKEVGNRAKDVAAMIREAMN